MIPTDEPFLTLDEIASRYSEETGEPRDLLLDALARSFWLSELKIGSPEGPNGESWNELDGACFRWTEDEEKVSVILTPHFGAW